MENQQIDEDWCGLRLIKLRAWGDRSHVTCAPNFNLHPFRQTAEGFKENHHSSFKRALELLAKSGYLEARCWSSWKRYELRVRREYRLTVKVSVHFRKSTLKGRKKVRKSFCSMYLGPSGGRPSGKRGEPVRNVTDFSA